MLPAGNDATILLGEDEPEIRNYLEMALKCHGYSVETAEDGEEILSFLSSAPQPFSAVLLDVTMPRKDGLETLREIRRVHADLPVIMISGEASPQRVMEAMRSGASDFLEKPVSHDDLNAALCKALNGARAWTAAPPDPEAAPALSDSLLIAGKRMREIQSILQQIGSWEVPVLIQGETGTGKEVVARQLHRQSRRAHKPFLKLNCAALPSELVESELFGYERGAFTGAFQRKPGMFEVADGGTILLDEIGDMDFKLQSKLLQVLQDQQFQRVGGKDPVQVDVRVLAATHRDLDEAIADNTFREDLYYRLNVITIRVPALRERRDEIMPLAEFLLRKHAPAGTAPLGIAPVLKQALLEHDWPGNVRELENVMKKYLVLREPEAIVAGLRSRSRHKPPLPNSAGNGHGTRPIPLARRVTLLEDVQRAKRQAETEAILTALNATHWNRKRAASLLNIDYKALLYKMKKLAIDSKDLKEPLRAYSSGGA